MRNKLRVLHISDTHGFHDLLSIPQDIDVLAFTGDESNRRDPHLNEAEFYDFAQCEYCTCDFIMVMRDIKTDKGYCSECNKEVKE